MRTRDLLMLCSALCLVTVVGLVVLGQNSLVEAFSPNQLPPTATGSDPSPPTAPPTLAEQVGITSTQTGLVPPAVSSAPTSARATVDTQGWTSGVVKGDIQLAVAVLDRLKTITVAVEEARAALIDGSFHQPHRILVPVKLGAGTPTFEVRDIPFSDYPYVVSVFAAGLNGGRRTVSINAEHPLVDDIVLAITPGAPFSVLVRDQDLSPYTGLEVRMLPVGEPAGRPRAIGSTDSFGSVVFESVLAGDYQVLVSQDGQPIGEANTITVQPGNRLLSTTIQGQSHVVTIARGVPLQIQISDPSGYGLADVQVKATATDKIRLTEIPAVTDFGGKVTFPRLTPGTWQISATLANFQTGFLQVHIKPGQLPELREMRMVRLR